MRRRKQIGKTVCVFAGVSLLAASAPVLEAAPSVGEIVTFGSYEQDGDTENGSEAIEWIVLAADQEKALLLSRYVLEGSAYHNQLSGTTWEDSRIRRWLREEFLPKAFSSEEQKALLTTPLKNPDNEEYGTAGGKNTKDSVFLLSATEAEKLLSDEQSSGYATDSVIADGLFVEEAGEYQGACGWWLRTPGQAATWASFVETDGVIDSEGGYICCEDYGIRPAVCVDITKLDS